MNCTHGLEGVRCRCAAVEIRRPRAHAMAVACFPNSVAFYPANDIEYGLALIRAAIEAHHE